MKRTFLKISLILLTAVFMFACSEDDSGNSNTTVDLNQARQDAQSGLWRVASMIDSGQDETGDFNSYEFDFRADGFLVATNGSTTYNGTWSITNSSSSSSSSSDFNINFPVPDDDDFDDLNDDWDIVTITNSLIDLIDVSGGNGGTDTLVFAKI